MLFSLNAVISLFVFGVSCDSCWSSQTVLLQVIRPLGVFHSVCITSKWEYRVDIKLTKHNGRWERYAFIWAQKRWIFEIVGHKRWVHIMSQKKSSQTSLRWRGSSLQKSRSSLKPCIATVNVAMESSWCSMYNYLQVTLCFISTGRLHYCCCFAVHLVNLN